MVLTDGQKNTLRAALRSHDDKLLVAVAGAQARGDFEHSEMLRRERTTVKELMAALVNS